MYAMIKEYHYTTIIDSVRYSQKIKYFYRASLDDNVINLTHRFHNHST